MGRNKRKMQRNDNLELLQLQVIHFIYSMPFILLVCRNIVILNVEKIVRKKVVLNEMHIFECNCNCSFCVHCV